jgi:plastocyanin
MRPYLAALAMAAFACGGGGSGDSAVAEASASEAPATASATSGGTAMETGTVHKVDMVLNDAGEYRFVPAELTIKVGDTVQWVNVSGGPHNVQFYADKIPAGAESVLNAAMKNRIGNLSGELLIAPNAVYEVSFAGAPVGTYGYTCTPHELLGMHGTLTIEQ